MHERKKLNASFPIILKCRHQSCSSRYSCRSFLWGPERWRDHFSACQVDSIIFLLVSNTLLFKKSGNIKYCSIWLFSNHAANSGQRHRTDSYASWPISPAEPEQLGVALSMRWTGQFICDDAGGPKGPFPEIAFCLLTYQKELHIFLLLLCLYRYNRPNNSSSVLL